MPLRFSYVWSNVKIINDDVFSGIVTVTTGTIMMSPELSFTVQNMPANVMLCNFNAAPPGPPVREFQTT